MNYKNIEIIGIDHGWSMIKTASQVFVTGIKEESTEPPLANNALEVDGKYYTVGGKRLEVRNNKIENDNYYNLTLAGIAMELRKRGKNEADVIIAAGLPIARFGDEKEGFLNYLKARKEVYFKFEKEEFHIRILNAVVFPQCYAAVLDRIQTMTERAVVVDIGSWTIDIIPIENRTPITSECTSLPEGLITCMHAINDECYKQLSEHVDDSIIQKVMRYGTANIDEKFLSVIQTEIAKYMDGIYNSLREHGVNLKTTPIIFCGGGAVVMKNFGNIQQRNISYVLDIKANAKGFELLANIGLNAKQKAGR